MKSFKEFLLQENEHLSESLDKPLPWKWDRQDQEWNYIASFKGPSGEDITVDFTNMAGHTVKVENAKNVWSAFIRGVVGWDESGKRSMWSPRALIATTIDIFKNFVEKADPATVKLTYRSWRGDGAQELEVMQAAFEKKFFPSVQKLGYRSTAKINKSADGINFTITKKK